MSIFIMILLAVLPVLLQWLLGYIHKGEHMSKVEAAQFHSEMDRYGAWLDQIQAADDNGELNDREKRKLKRALDIYNQIKAKSGAAGCQI